MREGIPCAFFLGAPLPLLRSLLLLQIPSERDRSAITPNDLLVFASVGGGSRQQAHIANTTYADMYTCPCS
ncbi:hypothetical protein DENSPDRAFT_845391 [Dentipellis sp. KUC8613]|nr:hypothetical protein DENSPDRAFT_845391 [Dentipellis sp. KUC8613]